MSKRRFHISRLKPSLFQGRLDFDAVSKRQTAVLAVEHPVERAMFMLFIAIIGVLICAYFYFVISSVFNVIARKEADASAATLQRSIGSLEQQYFSLSQTLTPQNAAAIGLTPIQQTQYVYRPGNSASVAAAVRAI